MAAGAMISLSFAVSPPLTLVPPLPVPNDVNGNIVSHQQQAIETVGSAAIDDRFARRPQTDSDDDVSPMPAPRRDLLEGLVGGLLTPPQDAPQETQAELHDVVAEEQPAQQESVTVVPRELPARVSDVCTRHGLRRIDYRQNHHRYWRCAYRR